jgi:hypothetical protein
LKRNPYQEIIDDSHEELEDFLGGGKYMKQNVEQMMREIADSKRKKDFGNLKLKLKEE